MNRKTNPSELYILSLAKGIPGVIARLSTAEEDCGYHKADVVVNFGGNVYYFQVSHTEKSKGERERLARRGTHPIATHKHPSMPHPEKDLVDSISGAINLSNPN